MKRSIRMIVRDMRNSLDHAVPYSLTFKPTGNLTAEQKKNLEADLKWHFENWERSWIRPCLDEIEEKLNRAKAKADREVRRDSF